MRDTAVSLTNLDSPFEWENPYDRRLAYEQKQKIHNTRKPKKSTYRRRPSKAHPDRGRFIAWDGEGYSVEGKHYYSLLASSDGAVLVAGENRSLERSDVFEAFLESRRQFPQGINVIFGGNYDFNCILHANGLPRWYLERLHEGEYIWLDGYRVKWIDGKQLYISDGETSVTVYDVFSFFQRSFLTACDEYLGTDYPHRELITSMKAQRSDFGYADLPEVMEYNKAELEVLVLLMEELRRRLDAADIPIGKWYGPGSIASQLMKRYNIKSAMVDTYRTLPQISAAAQWAYAGGRFEIFKCGHVEEPCYEYDINSAYPSAMRDLPNLAKGTWKHYVGDPGYHPYALYRVQSFGPLGANPASRLPHPLWTRIPQGVFYSHAGADGWFWTPDVECVRDSDHTYSILEAWVFEPYDDSKPFAFVEDLFQKRLALKKAGNGAHVGIKLGLNSLYGKMAQQVGWKKATDDSPYTIPPFHQLEWAGYVTSHCRLQLWRAIRRDPDAIIAVETDALFSRRPLDLPVGSGLGEWEETRFANLTYTNSGIYWATTVEGKEIQKSRGFHPRYITREMALEAMESGTEAINVPTKQFLTAGAALNGNYWNWTRWIESTRDIYLVPNRPGQKRGHIFGCQSCNPAQFNSRGDLIAAPSFTVGKWHDTICEYGDLFGRIPSMKFPVEWIDGPQERNADEEEW